MPSTVSPLPRPPEVVDLQRAYGLWDPNADVRVLARGTENVTLAVGGRYIVRLTTGSPAAVLTEGAVLRRMSTAGEVTVPQPVVCDGERGVLIYEALPGSPLLDCPSADPWRLVPGLEQLFAAMRQVGDDLPLAADEYSMADWHADAEEHYRAVRDRLPARQAGVIRAFLDRPPPRDGDRAVFCHNDLGAEHLLVDSAGRLSGVIDWTDAAYADPSRDLGMLHRDLGPAVARAVAQSVGCAENADLERIAFHARCKWLEDMRYALDEPAARARYLRNARRSFRPTFLEGTDP